ncbi:hypothetical protein PROFUN_06087 [Planoprotostelium fungivorum]|uniref:Lipase maturation factor 2 n=1 Tax=Planoprotostelium fungivorum TaxID=1890364 RepID=A0A2P6NPT6_9EUKA|nr:hypothetical protein PROFUN_06087 [Planoprotostelium fungivorum]
MGGTRTRKLFLSGLGLVYLVAFLSIYFQYGGLLSCSGLEPSFALHSSMKQHKGPDYARILPGLHHFYKAVGLDFDTFMLTTILSGAISSLLIVFGMHHALFFLACGAAYLTVVNMGQTFLSFQWDIILLEVTPLAALYCNLIPGKRGASMTIPSWMIRWLLFRLMFQAGVVKIQSGDATWTELRATEYHFATQCLPTAAAWFVHQLPQFVHKVEVAATFIIEIPAAVLVLLPGPSGVRYLAAGLQILLQLLIIVTGNYNFFNWLTILLTLPLLDDGLFGGKRKESRGNFIAVPIALAVLSSITASCFTLSTIDPRPFPTIQPDFSLFEQFIAHLHRTFSTHDLSFNLTVDRVDEIVSLVLPWICYYMSFVLLCLFFYEVNQIRKRVKKGKSVTGAIAQTGHLLMVFTISCLLFGASWKTLTSIDRHLYVPKWALQAHETVHPYHLASSYGLFRSMTGVGQNIRHHDRITSIVQRPEIIVEVRGKEGEWTELHFKHKPGDVNTRPTLVAPHQPRLDWQMWFAALMPRMTPWMTNMMFKLLKGGRESEAVWSLLDESRNGFNASHPPNQIRAVLHHYDFTRLLERPEAWWVRQGKGETYAGPFTDLRMMTEYVRNRGWADVCQRMRKDVGKNASSANLYLRKLHRYLGGG